MNILCRFGWHKLDREFYPMWNVMRGTKCLRCGTYPYGKPVERPKMPPCAPPRKP